MKTVVHDCDMPQEDRSAAAYRLEKIRDRLREDSEKKRALSEARYDVEGETLRTTSWTRSAHGYHPKDSIPELKVENCDSSSRRRLVPRKWQRWLETITSRFKPRTVQMNMAE